MSDKEEGAGASDSVESQELKALTNKFSKILVESLEGIRKNMQDLNNENANSFSAITAAMSEIQPKRGTPAISRAPTFSGESDNASNFLEKFQLYAKFHKWNNEELLQTFPLLLSGTAEIWYTTLDKSSLTSFDQLVKLLHDRFFLSQTANWVLRQELGQRKQGRNESLSAYSADIRRRCQRLAIPIGEQLHYFIQGLSPSIRNHVFLQQPKSLEEAENAARIKDSLNEPPSSALTANDVLTLQQNLIKRLEEKTLLANPSVAAYEQKNQNSSAPQDDGLIRRIIREELRSMGNFPSGQPAPPRLQFNARGDFGRSNRTTNGQIICHNCKRVGHHFRNCRLPNFRQNGLRQNGFRQNDFRSNNFRARDPRTNDYRPDNPRIPATQHNSEGGRVRFSGHPFPRDNRQSN